jgi:hypothetical protein
MSKIPKELLEEILEWARKSQACIEIETPHWDGSMQGMDGLIKYTQENAAASIENKILWKFCLHLKQMRDEARAELARVREETSLVKVLKEEGGFTDKEIYGDPKQLRARLAAIEAERDEARRVAGRLAENMEILIKRFGDYALHNTTIFVGYGLTRNRIGISLDNTTNKDYL